MKIHVMRSDEKPKSRHEMIEYGKTNALLIENFPKTIIEQRNREANKQEQKLDRWRVDSGTNKRYHIKQ